MSTLAMALALVQAQAVVAEQAQAQVVQVLRYVLTGQLPA